MWGPRDGEGTDLGQPCHVRLPVRVQTPVPLYSGATTLRRKVWLLHGAMGWGWGGDQRAEARGLVGAEAVLRWSEDRRLWSWLSAQTLTRRSGAEIKVMEGRPL